MALSGGAPVAAQPLASIVAASLTALCVAPSLIERHLLA